VSAFSLFAFIHAVNSITTIRTKTTIADKSPAQATTKATQPR